MTMPMRFKRVFVIAVFACALFAVGCGLRPTPTAPSADKPAPSGQTQIPEITPLPEYTVTYRLGEEMIAAETVLRGGSPAQIPALEDTRLLGWTDVDGNEVSPAEVTVEGDLTFYALTRPALNSGADFLFPDEHGFLLPQSPFTKADAAAALRALLSEGTDRDRLAERYESDPESAMTVEEFRLLLEELFTPRQTAEVMADAFIFGQEPLDRARAAWCLEALLNDSADETRYFPDVSPDHWAYAQLTAAAAPGALDLQSLLEMTLDGFVWFDGYLYRLDEEGYFVTGQSVDDLIYDENGRYTSGSEELDGYVAQTLTQLMEPGKTRLEHLRAAYLHVKNDFRYLPRNYYASGETGWTVPEALTMYQTGKGNCYNYTGVFWSLARGLGYNAVTYSGTMGIENQPHSWTEILLDGEIYICDPEIELNYWLLEMYTDNFMMKKEKSGGWNYQAVGRD